MINLAIVYMVTFPSITFAPKIGHRTTAVSASAHHSKREESKRGLNIGLQLKMPQETSNDTLKTIEKELAKVIGKGLAAGDSTAKDSTSLENKAQKDKKLLLKPAFQCDQWDYQTRTCWLDRNTGDTVTFSLSTGVRSKKGRPDVVWKKEFAQRESRAVKEYVINPNRTSRNLVIGHRGYELRVSPITEIDLDDNQFSAAFVTQHDGQGTFAKVNFRIRPMPEDLGFVYIGETLDLSIESYVTLPLESIAFHWYTEKEGESASLPSNMRVSETGETLRVSELRQEQEGVLACSAYTNIAVHATKKRFLVKELAKNKDVLKSFANHSIAYQEAERKKHRRRTAKYHHPRRNTFTSTTPTEPPGVANTTIPTTVIAYQEAERQKHSKRTAKYHRKRTAKYHRKRTAKYHRSRRIASTGATPTEPPGGANTTTAIAYQEAERPKHWRRISEYHRPRRIVSTGTTPTEPPGGANTTTAKKSPPKRDRDTNVEGESYTFVKPFNEDASWDQQRPAAEDGIYSAGQEDANVSIGGSEGGAETVVDINSERERNVEEDGVSRLLASCIRDLQCSKHAYCVRTNLREKGFCRCLPGFYGPGIFCREEM